MSPTQSKHFFSNFIGMFIAANAIYIIYGLLTRSHVNLDCILVLIIGLLSYWYASACAYREACEDEETKGNDSAPSTTQPDPGHFSKLIEQSAGVVLRQEGEEDTRVLLIRVRKDFYEIPKGHIEQGETPRQAALRELEEETNLLSDVTIVRKLGTLSYSFKNHSGTVIEKQVTYFLGKPHDGVLEFGDLPSGTRELLWVNREELETTPMASEELKKIVSGALE